MDLTTDKLKSLVKKWHSLIETFADVKTTDGYYMRMFCIGFTKKQQNQVSKTSYAQSSQKRQVSYCGLWIYFILSIVGDWVAGVSRPPFLLSFAYH